MIYPVATRGANAFASREYGRSNIDANRADRFHILAQGERQRDQDRVLGEARQNAQDRQAKKAEDDQGGAFGGLGAAGGAIIGAVLAIPTGGASLALTASSLATGAAAGSAIGGGIERSVSGDPGGGAKQISKGFSDLASRQQTIDAGMVDNPLYRGDAADNAVQAQAAGAPGSGRATQMPAVGGTNPLNQLSPDDRRRPLGTFGRFR